MGCYVSSAGGSGKRGTVSTICNADRIIVLEDGRIREVGDHHELLARGGLYSQLYQRQLELAATGAEEQ